MSAVEVMVTAETEEAQRVIAHIHDLNRSIAESELGTSDVPQLTAARCRAVQRLQALPILLGDFRFTDVAFWRDCVRLEPRECDVAPAPTQAMLRLSRHLLSVAWHCGRAGAGSRLLLGIDREVGQLIASLRFCELDAIAVACAAEVRRRWADVPEFWSQMLDAAQQGSEERWSRIQVHALRLLGRDWL